MQLKLRIKRELIYGVHIDQAEENSRGFIPAVVIKRNGHKPLVVMSAEDWISRENWLQGS